MGAELFDSQEPISLQIAVFPQEQMRYFPGFSDDEKKQVASYMINRENSGFFFYRNDRLILWGLHTANVGRDDLGFRAVIRFTTAHDDMFHVDVSKQHLELSEDFEHKLTLLCRTPLAHAREAFEICRRMRSQRGPEGETFNERTEVFDESDPTEEVERVPVEVKVERLAILEADTRAREDEESAAAETPPDLSDPSALIFKRVRYSDRVLGLDLAVSGTDRNEGTYVRINQDHPFYDLVIRFFDPSNPGRLAIEALLWASAVAEVKTLENLAKYPYDQILAVFTHYRRVLSQILNAWANTNQDLFS